MIAMPYEDEEGEEEVDSPEVAELKEQLQTLREHLQMVNAELYKEKSKRRTTSDVPPLSPSVSVSAASVTAELDARARQWSLERNALQAQLQELRTAGASAAAAKAAAAASAAAEPPPIDPALMEQLEGENECLRQELDALTTSLRSAVLVPKDHLEKLIAAQQALQEQQQQQRQQQQQEQQQQQQALLSSNSNGFAANGQPVAGLHASNGGGGGNGSGGRHGNKLSSHSMAASDAYISDVNCQVHVTTGHSSFSSCSSSGRGESTHSSASFHTGQPRPSIPGMDGFGSAESSPGFNMQSPQMSGGGAAATPTLSAMAQLQQQQQQLGSAAGHAGATLSLSSGVNLPRLLQEKAALERELLAYKEHCIAVGRNEYTVLQSVHSQNSYLEKEINYLRSELESSNRIAALLEEEMELMKAGSVMISTMEYERLQQTQAEHMAAQHKADATARYCVNIPRAEHARLLQAVSEVDALKEQLAQATSGLMLPADQAAYRELQQEASTMCAQFAALSEELSVTKRHLASAEAWSATAQSGASSLTVAESKLASSLHYNTMVEQRNRGLQNELNTVRQALEAATAERDAARLDLGSAKDAATKDNQALLQLRLQHEAAVAQVAALQEELAAVTQQLVSARLEMAEAKELELHVRRDIVKTKSKLGHILEVADNDADSRDYAIAAAAAAAAAVPLRSFGASASAMASNLKPNFVRAQT